MRTQWGTVTRKRRQKTTHVEQTDKEQSKQWSRPTGWVVDIMFKMRGFSVLSPLKVWNTPEDSEGINGLSLQGGWGHQLAAKQNTLVLLRVRVGLVIGWGETPIYPVCPPLLIVFLCFSCTKRCPTYSLGQQCSPIYTIHTNSVQITHKFWHT